MKEYITFREKYITEIREELLGPGSEISIPDEQHEIISSRPDKRYSMGILFPQKNKMEQDNDEIEEKIEEVDIEDAEELIDKTSDKSKPICKKSGIDDDTLDEEVSLSAQNLPSSMGISFITEGNSKEIKCDITFATYEKLRPNECKVYNYQENDIHVPEEFTKYVYYDKIIDCLCLKEKITRKEVRDIWEKDISDDKNLLSSIYRLADQSIRGHKRIPHEVEVVLEFEQDEYIDRNRNIDDTMLKVTALRRELKPGIFSITIMVVNEERDKSNGRNCIYQTKISISNKKNNFQFIDINQVRKYELDYEESDEEKELELLYRKKKAYATGLGTACIWEINKNGDGVLSTEYLPSIELPQVDFNLKGEKPEYLSMKYLSDLNSISTVDKIEKLRNLLSSYDEWIQERRSEVNEFKSNEEHLRKIAFINLDKCQKSLNRMENGLKILASKKEAMDSFVLANRAMYMQREQLLIQQELSSKDRYDGDEEVSNKLRDIDYINSEDKHSWRPFQLAFLLMSIESIIDDTCDDRLDVDLIWFPTGGGKTEAYLGLTAFTIFYRRFVYSEVADGTAVIMRYTLRLLAAQQFTRASTLICACELIRRESKNRRSRYQKYNLGTDRITIGLWIGNKHTPNKNEKANEHINELLKSTYNNLNVNKEQHNKFQVLKCPWCGTKLEKDIVNKKIVGKFGYRMENNKHFFMHCTHQDCSFRDVLPIQVVDDELFSKPPTLLFGTVDKFAMLPWKQEVGNFFASRTKNRPPELIIQDELHLISGPLGTIVGLFESAIDGICNIKGVKPKIVASTATIRRAKEQCSGLYNREINQFPAPGINAEDSFFAREKEINHETNDFGRVYLGMMPTGKTKVMMQIRTISTYLQKVYEADENDMVKDKYWTLTIYFNSLKELGKCRTLIDDDVKDALKRLSMRMGKRWRQIGSADELTSRVSTIELNKTLDKLEKLQYSEDNFKSKRYASNTLIATNMISVGIDVERLNAMILVGQPKLTSEYIQASSRVGRKYPGIATVLYDGTKSRDRSHYEQFVSYHQSYYRYVEPTSVTPFSRPALERALHSVIVGMIRNISDLDKEKKAAEFNRVSMKEELEYIKQFVINRYKEINERSEFEINDVSDEIEKQFEDFIDRWEIQISNYDGDSFVYGYKYIVKHPTSEQGRLLKVFNSDRNDLKSVDTLTSMRNVDSSVKGNILIWEDDKNEI